MKIPSETVELIRSRLDIVELVSESVPLTRAGRNLKARCPFHQERSPSFIVSPERQTFHCFGCGEGGDAFSFVMKTEGLSFLEAAETLATRAGVKLEAERELSPQERERLKLREALEFAAGHYHELLKKDAQAEPARQYVAKRRLSMASVEGFLIGYAPRNGRLVAAAMGKGFTEDLLVKAGLAAKRPDGTLRDYFFDRLLFPIRDAKGGFVGFGGRALGDGEPKYLNSPESPVFAKSRVLYGLFEGLGETRKARRVQLMEGYMDVIASHQHGLKTACAPLGTALTAEHAVLIKRYADSVVIVFDADAAGQGAAVRGAEIALEAGLGTRVASVPEGKDPDEFLHARGLAAFSTQLELAVDLVAFKTELLIRRAGELTPEAKSAIARDLLGTIARCPDEVLKDEWVRRLAGRLRVSEDSLRREGGKLSARGPWSRPAAASSAGAARLAGRTAQLSALDRLLFGLLFKAPACAPEFRPEDFESADAKTLFSAVVLAAREAADWTRVILDRFEDPGLRGLVTRLLVDENLSSDPVSHCRGFIEKVRLQRRQRELEPLVLGVPKERVDPALFEEYCRITSRLQGSKSQSMVTG